MCELYHRDIIYNVSKLVISPNLWLAKVVTKIIYDSHTHSTLLSYIHYVHYMIWHKCYDIIDGTRHLNTWQNITENFRDKILEKILKILIQSLPCIFAERNKGYQIGEKFVIKDYGDSHVDFQVKTTIFHETTKHIS